MSDANYVRWSHPIGLADVSYVTQDDCDHCGRRIGGAS